MELNINRRISIFLIFSVATSYLVMLLGGGAIKPEYSHLEQYISELNATGTPFSMLIGYLGFVPFGVLSAILIVFVLNQASMSGITKVGVCLLFAEPIAYIGSAIAPCDVGCPSSGSASQNAHNVLAIFTYLFTWLALVIFAFTPGIKTNTRIFWFLCSLLWLLLLSLMVDSSLSSVRGGLQRLAEGVIYCSLLAAAWRVLSKSRNTVNAPC